MRTLQQTDLSFIGRQYFLPRKKRQIYILIHIILITYTRLFGPNYRCDLYVINSKSIKKYKKTIICYISFKYRPTK